jgi:hypothetical protein
MKGPKPRNLIVSLTEGLLGYLIYQSRCGLHEAYSEYLLYDPTVRIAKDKGWQIKSEFIVDTKLSKGDKKRIDFLFTDKINNTLIGLEVKYLKNKNSLISIANDLEKLNSLQNHVEYNKMLCFIIIAGYYSDKCLNQITKLSEKHGHNKQVFTQEVFTGQFKRKYGVSSILINPFTNSKNKSK